jgi:hypothetical protein
MFDRAAPPFHANFLVELFEQTGSRELVGTAAQLLLKDCSPNHIRSVRRFLPVEILRICPTPPRLH